jgi:hypothetical protein
LRQQVFDLVGESLGHGETTIGKSPLSVKTLAGAMWAQPFQW